MEVDPQLLHRAKMGVYFLLDEEQFSVRPPYGNVVLRDGTRYRVENDTKLQACVLDPGQKDPGRAVQGRGTDPGESEAWPMPAMWPKGALCAGTALLLLM
jgi:hypothetical protein